MHQAKPIWEENLQHHRRFSHEWKIDLFIQVKCYQFWLFDVVGRSYGFKSFQPQYLH